MMLAKLFNKQSSDSKNGSQVHKAPLDLNPRAIVHYGIPSIASRLAYDPIQQLLAIGTLDGRIKVICRDNIEGLLTSPKEIPFKNLEFLQNQGFLVSISNYNDVQVWDLERRCIASSLQWQSNITAFAVIQDTSFMYIGDECGLVSVVKYDVEERKLLTQPFSIPAHSVCEAAAASLPENLSVVGILPQPCSGGKRVLFVYDSGVIVLWDVYKDQLVLIKGLNDQQKKEPADYSTNAGTSEQTDESKDDEQEDKEIISLCWASSDGSILAVGYVNGDILLWNLASGDNKAGKSSNDAVKLQLSTADRRFPVITLQWSAFGPCNDNGGQLFVYGGDEIGSPEVLTILSLQWSSGRDALKNVIRTNITLEGSFADMILLPNFNVLENTGTTSLFLLSSPGQLQFYDAPVLSGLVSPQPESCTTPINYRSAVPTTEPYLTIGKLILIKENSRCVEALLEMASAAELDRSNQTSNNTSTWPINSGVPCELPIRQERVIERLYIGGYQDGSVRLWDSTYPMLYPLFRLYPEVRGVNIPGATGPITSVDFSLETSQVAVGNGSGMVCLYSLTENSREAKVHIVTGSDSEVYKDQGNGSKISAVFSLSTSPVCTLRYTQLGSRLAVGYESGQVALLSVDSSSVLFLTDALSDSSSPVISIKSTMVQDCYGFMNSLDESEINGENESGKGFLFALRRDKLISVLDSSNGNIINSIPVHHIKESPAVSMYILEDTKCVTEAPGSTHVHAMSQENKANSEPEETSDHFKDSSDRSKIVAQSLEDMQILICCTDVLLLYSLQSLLQGPADSIREVSLKKPSCWNTILDINEKKLGLLSLYQNGSIEIRSLPQLEILGEMSLLSLLRWNFKTNMDKTTSCTENGQLTLVNGCEFAVVSLFDREDDFRFQHCFPCLHDKALEAALSMEISRRQQRNKETPSGILGGIIKGLRASKEAECKDSVKDQHSLRSSLDRIFSRTPEESTTAAKDTGVILELNIDDIEIDEPLHISPKPHKKEDETKDKSAERNKLFEGASTETKPKPRTIEEIKAKYRKGGDTSSAVTSAASAASEAKNKLMERGEKLDRISQNSEQLRDGAENFASMAKELAKRMENRKWWQI